VWEWVTALFQGHSPFTTATSFISYAFAAVATVRAGWLPRRGSRGLPDEQAVPKGYSAMATPVMVIGFAVLYYFFGNPIQPIYILVFTLLFLVLGTVGGFGTYYMTKRHGIPYTDAPGKILWLFNRQPREVIKLGGSKFTVEAQRDVDTNNKSDKTLLEQAQGDVYLVFTKDSIAAIHTTILAFFLAFEVFGTMALFGAGLLLSND
jgi:hypothetical protein